MLAVWTLVLGALVPAAASASASDESSFIAEVNATRAAVGLPALQPDVQLTNLARGWATSMRDGVCGAGNFICHASPISAGVTHSWAKLGENVGTGPDIGSVMDAFIASPGHYANIIDPEFTHIGVGVVWDGNRLYTTHRFMKLQGPAPTTTAPPQTTTTSQAPSTTAPAATTAATLPSSSTTADPPRDVQSTAPVRRAGFGTPQPKSVLRKRVTAVLGAITKLT